MTSSPELPRCDTELSLGRSAPAPPPCRATGELKQGGGGLTATELQAMAILRAAAAEEEEGAAGLSMRRSMEWFLQRRREARRLSLRAVAADSAAASPSSPSFSCLTDSSRI